MYQPVHDVGKPSGIGICLQDIKYVLQHGHFPVFFRVPRIIQAFIVMGDAFLFIGLYQGLVQQLPFLMGHVGNEQGKENVEPLYLGGKLRFFRLRPVQQIICGGIHLPDFHDIDTVPGSGGNLDELPADIAAGTVKFMAL